MIKINLLPREIEQKAVRKKKGILVAGAVILFVGVIFGLYMLRVAELKSLNNKIAEADRELKKLEPVVKKVQEIEDQKAGLDKKIAVIEDLMQVRLITPVFMEQMASILPEGVWITSLASTSGENSLDLNLTVMARDNYAAADLLNTLEVSEKFSDVNFTGLSSTTYQEDEIRTFKLRCRYEFKGVD